MKYIKHSIKLLTLTLFALTVSSCSEEFLEVIPKGSVIAQKISDYDLLLDDPSLNVLPSAAVPMGDEVAGVEPFLSNSDLVNQRLFRWDDEVYNVDRTPEAFTFLTTVYAYNKIINEAGDAVDGTEIQKKSIIAEAKVGRAMIYFSLINYFGKPYNSETAASDAGYPIVKDSDITLTNFSRNTVEEVYDFIIADLTQAIPDLPKVLAKRTRAGLITGEALLGKVLMFKRDFSGALEHLQNAYDLIPTSKPSIGLTNYNDAFADDGLFMPLSPFIGPNYPLAAQDPEVIYAKTINNFWAFFYNEIATKPETTALFGASDLRLNFYSTSQSFGFDKDYPDGMMRRWSTLTSPAGLFLPEIILLMAEANTRLGNLGAATAALEDFRASRMPLADVGIANDIKADQDKLIKYIFEERIREFAVYGYRWFDMRRLSVDPKYNNLVNYTHPVYDQEGNVIETYTMKPERLVMRFGAKVRSQNPNLIDNP